MFSGPSIYSTWVDFRVFDAKCFTQTSKAQFVFLHGIISLFQIYHFEVWTAPEFVYPFCATLAMICAFVVEVLTLVFCNIRSGFFLCM